MPSLLVNGIYAIIFHVLAIQVTALDLQKSSAGTLPADNHPMTRFLIFADQPWLLAVIQLALALPGLAIILFKVFGSTRKLVVHDHYRFAVWFLGNIVFNVVLQGIVFPFATDNCTPEMASGITAVSGLISYAGHWLVYSYSLDRLVGRRWMAEAVAYAADVPRPFVFIANQLIVWPQLKPYGRFRPLVAAVISIPGFLMYAVDNKMLPLASQVTHTKTLVNLQAAVVIICETTFLLAFTYPILNVKRLAGSMKLSVKMVGVIERLSIQYVSYFAWLITSVIVYQYVTGMAQPLLAEDMSNIEYVRRLRFGWARASAACGVGLVYLSVYTLWISDILTAFQRSHNRDSFIWPNEASFQTFMDKTKGSTTSAMSSSISSSSSADSASSTSSSTSSSATTSH